MFVSPSLCSLADGTLTYHHVLVRLFCLQPRQADVLASRFSVDTLRSREWEDWWTSATHFHTPTGVGPAVDVKCEWARSTGLIKMVESATEEEAAARQAEDDIKSASMAARDRAILEKQQRLSKRWESALRELINESQNSYDHLEQQQRNLWKEGETAATTVSSDHRSQLDALQRDYTLRAAFKTGQRIVRSGHMALRRIDVVVDVLQNTITLQNTGMGTRLDDLRKELGTLTRAEKYEMNFVRELAVKLDTEPDDVSTLSGSMQMGIYSMFLVCDSVTVVTVDWETSDQLFWSAPSPISDSGLADGTTDFQQGMKVDRLTANDKDYNLLTKRIGRGTKYILKFKDGGMPQLTDVEDGRGGLTAGLIALESFLREQSTFVNFPICIWENEAPSANCVQIEAKTLGAQSRAPKSTPELSNAADNPDADSESPEDDGSSGGNATDFTFSTTDDDTGGDSLHTELHNCSCHVCTSARDQPLRVRSSFGKDWGLDVSPGGQEDIIAVKHVQRWTSEQTWQRWFIRLTWIIPAFAFAALTYNDVTDPDFQWSNLSLKVMVEGVLGSIVCHQMTTLAAAILAFLYWFVFWGFKAVRQLQGSTAAHGSATLPQEGRISANINQPVIVHVDIRSTVPYDDLELNWYRLTEEHDSYFSFLQEAFGETMQNVLGDMDRLPLPKGYGHVWPVKPINQLINSSWFTSFVGSINVAYVGVLIMLGNGLVRSSVIVYTFMRSCWLVLSCILIGEVVVKLIGAGVYHYKVSPGPSYFDLYLAVCCLVELLMVVFDWSPESVGLQTTDATDTTAALSSALNAMCAECGSGDFTEAWELIDVTVLHQRVFGFLHYTGYLRLFKALIVLRYYALRAKEGLEMSTRHIKGLARRGGADIREELVQLQARDVSIDGFAKELFNDYKRALPEPEFAVHFSDFERPAKEMSKTNVAPEKTNSVDDSDVQVDYVHIRHMQLVISEIRKMFVFWYTVSHRLNVFHFAAMPTRTKTD